jgi:excisionase family DNA binding protein
VSVARPDRLARGSRRQDVWGCKNSRPHARNGRVCRRDTNFGTPHAMPELLTTRDVTAYLGVSINTIQRLVKAGALPAIKLGPAPNASVRFQLADVIASLSSREDRCSRRVEPVLKHRMSAFLDDALEYGVWSAASLSRLPGPRAPYTCFPVDGFGREA